MTNKTGVSLAWWVTSLQRFLLIKYYLTAVLLISVYCFTFCLTFVSKVLHRNITKKWNNLEICIALTSRRRVFEKQFLQLMQSNMQNLFCFMREIFRRKNALLAQILPVLSENKLNFKKCMKSKINNT